jgi:hypothetical protein
MSPHDLPNIRKYLGNQLLGKQCEDLHPLQVSEELGIQDPSWLWF